MIKLKSQRSDFVEFKDRIKLLRETSNLSLTQLALEFGKTEAAVRAWELGRTKPEADTIIKLSKFFNCSTDYILGLSNIKTYDEQQNVNEKIDNIINNINNLTLNDIEIIENTINTVKNISEMFEGFDYELYILMHCLNIFSVCINQIALNLANYKICIMETNLVDKINNKQYFIKKLKEKDCDIKKIKENFPKELSEINDINNDCFNTLSKAIFLIFDLFNKNDFFLQTNLILELNNTLERSKKNNVFD